jgi:hypothetical protein
MGEDGEKGLRLKIFFFNFCRAASAAEKEQYCSFFWALCQL